MWMDWQATTLLPDMTVVFWGLIRTPEAERDYAEIEAAAGGSAAPGGSWSGTWPTGAIVAGDTPHDRRHPGRRQLLSLFRAADRAAAAAQHRAWYGRLKRRPPFREHVMLPLT